MSLASTFSRKGKESSLSLHLRRVMLSHINLAALHSINPTEQKQTQIPGTVGCTMRGVYKL